MDTTMEFDDIKSAWQTLEARLARQDRLQRELLRERRHDQARRNLRPLFAGLFLQLLLGIGLVALGVGCWKHNPHAPGLFATGVALHAFGILNIAFAGIIGGVAAGTDHDAPVLAIQKRLRLLLRLQLLNSSLCGAPWWVAWVLVVIGFAGLSPARVADSTPAWIWISLGLGVVGTLATWAWTARARRRSAATAAPLHDGADAIRRNLRLFEDLERFERD